MNERVEEQKGPDGHRHVAHTSPHAHHGTGMMVCLQSRAQLALGNDDQGVNNLVELADVKQPSVESQSLIPHTAAGGAIRASGERSAVRVAVPAMVSVTVVDAIADTWGPEDTAEAVRSAGPARWPRRAKDTAPQHAERPPPCPSRVDGKENVVRHNKPKEGSGLADCPWPLVCRLVIGIQELDGDGISGCNRNGHLGIQPSGVHIVGNVERGHKC